MSFEYSSNFVFLAIYDNYIRFNKRSGFFRSKNGKGGVTRDSSHKISSYMRFSCSSGGHIGLFVIRPPGGYLNLFAIVFGNFIPIPITIPNFKNLSPSARFYLYMAYSSPALTRPPPRNTKYKSFFWPTGLTSAQLFSIYNDNVIT